MLHRSTYTVSLNASMLLVALTPAVGLLWKSFFKSGSNISSSVQDDEEESLDDTDEPKIYQNNGKFTLRRIAKW